MVVATTSGFDREAEGVVVGVGSGFWTARLPVVLAWSSTNMVSEGIPYFSWQ